MPQTPPKHGRHCWVAGWGHMTEGFNVASLLQVISCTIFFTNFTNYLQEVGVNLFSWEYCTEKSAYPKVINREAELCAGVPDKNDNGLIDGGKDACQGKIIKRESHNDSHSVKDISEVKLNFITKSSLL